MISQKRCQSIYWRSVINQIEHTVRKKTKREQIKKYDFYSTLPKKLEDRVAKIIPLDYNDDQIKEALADNIESIDGIDETKQEVTYNESTCSLIERREKEFTVFDLNLEETVEKKPAMKKPDNWFTPYICNERRDRIKWKSKLYQLEKNMWEKPLDEQAEQLMDASAERFTDWINTLGSKSEKEMTKEQLKSLFSIEGNSKLLASIQTDPKEVKAIAKTVADRWNMPDMAIELKYEKYINQHLKTAPKEVNKVAFGKTIPYKNRPWVCSKEDVTIKTIFPDELQSGEHLFKGISHLRSTKALIDYCKKKPSVPRPRYLVENGYFKAASKRVSEGELPLYELLKIK